MTYLKPGETLESRLDELMVDFRNTPTNATTSRDRYRDEASLVIGMIQAQAATIPGAMVELEATAFVGGLTVEGVIAAFDAVITDQGPVRPIAEERVDFIGRLVASLSPTPAPTPAADLVKIDDAVESLDAVLATFPPDKLEVVRAAYIAHLAGAFPENWVPDYDFTPAAIAKVRDSLALQPNADGSTPRLPEEQSPTSDENPAVDFDDEVDEAEDDDEDELDFRPVKDPGKPAPSGETPLKTLKNKTTKKEKSK